MYHWFDTTVLHDASPYDFPGRIIYMLHIHECSLGWNYDMHRLALRNRLVLMPPTLWCFNIQNKVFFASLWRFSNRQSGGLNIPWRGAGETRERCRWIWTTWWSFIVIKIIASYKVSLNRYEVNWTISIRIMQRHCIILAKLQCCMMWDLKQALRD